MKYCLDFATFNIWPNKIIEVVINEGVVITLEMCEEVRKLLAPVKSNDFACLINKVNDYTLSFESQLNMLSESNIKAIAFVYYTDKAKMQSENLIQLRKVDKWNAKLFSGREMGWQEAHDWLNSEMNKLKS